LKAIHNKMTLYEFLQLVVINRKTTKFGINLQLYTPFFVYHIA